MRREGVPAKDTEATSIRVLVNSPDRDIGDFLKERLFLPQWEVISTRPGP